MQAVYTFHSDLSLHFPRSAPGVCVGAYVWVVVRVCVCVCIWKSYKSIMLLQVSGMRAPLHGLQKSSENVSSALYT